MAVDPHIENLLVTTVLLCCC